MKNCFGKIFQVSTFGESHGKAIGVLIDGCPAGISIDEKEIAFFLQKRAPGKAYTSPRKEVDVPEILSGVFSGKTTGAPICILIANKDQDPSKYEPIKELYRPGHSNYTYLQKYGIFDYRGGGRASARETAARVAAGAVAKKLLEKENICITTYLQKVGNIEAKKICRKALEKSAIFCADSDQEQKICALLQKLKKDSVGGVVECIIQNCPIGLGEPVYEKLQAKLAKGMFSIPAVKGFEIGKGFASASMQGSHYNDLLGNKEKEVFFRSNHQGGILGGISTGQDIVFRVAFKPTSSILKPQNTVDIKGNTKTFILPKGSRHDPCVAIRGTVVVEAMAYLVLADAYLLNRLAKR